MRFSFAWKLGIAFSLLAVTVTGLVAFIIYDTTNEMVVEQMGNRLLDIGHAGSFVFTDQEREDIKFLKKELKKYNEFKATPEQLKDFEADENWYAGIPEDKANEIMATPQYQRVNQAMRKVREGTRKEVRPPGQKLQPWHIIQANSDDLPSIKYIFMIVPTPGFEAENYITYLVDTDYLPVDANNDGDYDDDGDYEGNSIGSLESPSTSEMHLSFKGPIAEKEFTEDKWGVWLSGYVPIKDKDGTTLAILGMDYNVQSAANKLRGLFWNCVYAVLIALVLSGLLAFLFAHILNKPIKSLNEGAERVAEGDYSTQVTVKSRDELGQLANTFNSMVDEIRDYTLNLTELNEAYERFVPKEFLQHMGTDDIKKLKLGDQIQREMSVLFADIRSFTTLSEKMSPAENFNFLNSYLQRVSPHIRDRQGFIDKFIGDAIMALFPREIKDAVHCAIDMQTEVKDFNVYRQRNDRPPIGIGLGLHTGMLMLGTIGEAKRMEATVIADAVNLASRLEGLTKRFGSQILMSEYSMSKLGKTDGVHIRYLGRVRVKGKKKSTRVFEIFNCDDEGLIQAKIDTMPRFEEAIALFNEAKFGEAGGLFAEVIADSPEDKAARVYLERCERLLAS